MTWPLRIRRTVLNAATALSLMICMAAVVEWLCGNWFYSSVHHVSVDRTQPTWLITEIGVGSSRGQVIFSWDRVWFHQPTAQTVLEDVVVDPPGWNFHGERTREPYGWQTFVESLSFKFHTLANPNPLYGRFVAKWVAVPYWFLILLGSPLSLLTLRRLLGRRRRPVRVGLCPACGYDLRATPDRCPECGRETVTAV